MKTKKLFFIMLAVLLGAGFCVTDTFAYEYKETNTFGKLSRGLVNIVTSPVEVARNVYIESQYESAFYGMTIGLGKGIGQTLLRFGAGVVETVTFPFNFPDEFKDPIIDPEYVWEEW